MIEINRSALLPYTTEQIFYLINDIEAYSHYMDGCIGSQITVLESEYMEARLDLSKAGFHYSLTTRNTLSPPYTIAMELVDGPFEAFSGQWTLKPLDISACKVSLGLQFTIRNKVLGRAAALLFNPMADNLVDALVKRAHHLLRTTPNKLI